METDHHIPKEESEKIEENSSRLKIKTSSEQIIDKFNNHFMTKHKKRRILKTEILNIEKENRAFLEEYWENPEDNNLLKKLPLQPLSYYAFKDGISMIGSFNIRAFGLKKLKNNDIMRIIIPILRRYDIILCQEVHLNDEEMIEKLVDMVSNSSVPYSYTLSYPVGKSLNEERFSKHSYKERYLYLYKPNKWKLLDNYIANNSQFVRMPYVAQFQHLKKPHVKITLIGCHTQPGHAYNEIKALVTDVYAYVKKKSVKKSSLSCLLSLLCLNTKEAPIFGENCEHIILMGDFNASGSYLNKTKQAELDKILAQNNLIWGISHSSDTTVASKRAAYDRFIFEVKNKNRWIGDIRVWEFDKFWKDKYDPALITKLAMRVSDHYPIEFELKLT
ncbi:10828_t:CDS:2 [Racocetra fulgida]|uniref:10828_t:CDS:1 n=1 Tax=Racocetra fulgida TaxID=60492 RepID=A0A9N8WI47_9GLOM|nr:10828_t:CDS:2 [Racocetra fulgida]